MLRTPCDSLAVRKESRQTRIAPQGNQAEAPRRQRRRWSEGEKRRLVEEWQRSDLSRAEYCRRHGLTYCRFLAWHKALTGGDEFVEVNLQEPAPARPPIGAPAEAMAEIVAPSGWRLRLPVHYSNPAELVKLIAKC